MKARTPFMVGLLLISLTGCTALEDVRHGYVMRGQVVEVTGDTAVVCVGTADGAEPGQELGVYRLISRNVGGPARNPPQWVKERVGGVRITEVLDEHFARANVISGTVEPHHIVELKR